MNYDIKCSGERIRQLRIKNGFTQAKTANVLNIDQSFYGRIELGKRGCSVDLFIQISELFDVSLDYLIMGKTDNVLLKESDVTQLKFDIEDLVKRLERLKTVL